MVMIMLARRSMLLVTQAHGMSRTRMEGKWVTSPAIERVSKAQKCNTIAFCTYTGWTSCT